jgi:tripartite-type tricarboxylate transporter receptor subunit TctC
MKKFCLKSIVPLLGLCGLLSVGVAHAQNTPYKMIVSTPAGGYLDVLARAIAPDLSKELGAPVVIESLAGANGMIATSAIARAPTDGRTLLLINTAISQNEATQKTRPYEISQVKPVTLIGLAPLVYAVNKSTGASTLKDYLGVAANAAPGKFSYGTTGTGSSGHVLGEILNGLAKTAMTHVPYKGAAPAYADLVAGHISSVFGGPGDLGRLLPTNTFSIVAITTEDRLPQHPHIPTFKELGYPEMSISGITTILVPSGTPREATERLTAAFQKVGAIPAVNQRLVELGLVPTWLNADDAAQYIHRDIGKWKKAISDYAIKLD